MRPFYRNQYYRRSWWNYRTRRNRFRRRRPRKTLRKYRRRPRVRKRRFLYTYKKKAKKIKVQQWQPSSIRRCSIKGILLLFEAGHGRFPNNFTQYKESFVPPRTPGGGGWSIQQLGLGNLYTQNEYFMNWWTHSNKGLNMVRYRGCKIKLYRQKEIDYIFTYFTEKPQNADKFWFPSFHPFRLLMDKHKIIVPSLQTQPLKRKLYKSVYIKPPKMLKTDWYFQQNLSNYPLVYFAAAATSLNHMFLSSKAENNNCSVNTLNTGFFYNSAFQYYSQTTGYIPRDGTYMYGLQNGAPDYTKEKRTNLIFLGDTHYNDPGQIVGSGGWQTYSNPKNWGNIFYHEYFNLYRRVLLITKPPSQFLQKEAINNDIGTEGVQKSEPLWIELRYNPYKDKGDGNIAYWKCVSDAKTKGWDPPQDPDLIIKGYPFWLMLWGWEDHSRKLSKLRDLDNNWILVLRSTYFNNNYTAVVPLSYSFVNGRAPYNNDPEDISPEDYRTWYPKWKFQKEAINDILMTGPGVCKAENVTGIQAFMKYHFFFKWGGEPATMENIADPNSQPISPLPREIFTTNEIVSPEESIENLLYKWDTRRDTITTTALQRIRQCQPTNKSVFTDGRQTSTDLPQTTQTQDEKKTKETEEETLLQQLNNLQQLNTKLQLRFLKLKQLTMGQ
nr:MAG: ORF1 [TTV-like mini virus]